jgi:hypothetical protein
MCKTCTHLILYCYLLWQILYPIGCLTLYGLIECIINQSINQSIILFISTGMKIYTTSFLQFTLYEYKGWHYILMVYTMAQPVSHRALILKGLVQPQLSPCEMCDGQSCNGIGFSPCTEDFPLSVFPLMLHTQSFTYHGYYITLATTDIIT